MKKIMITALLLSASYSQLLAQLPKHAIGIRTENQFFNPHYYLNYQLRTGMKSRFDFNLRQYISTYNSQWNVSGNYSVYHQHLFPVQNGLSFIAGYGMSFNYTQRLTNHTVGLGGTFGLEYNFNRHNLPLALSFDVRPTLYINHQQQTSVYVPGSVSLRYTFGNKTPRKSAGSTL